MREIETSLTLATYVLTGELYRYATPATLFKLLRCPKLEIYDILIFEIQIFA